MFVAVDAAQSFSELAGIPTDGPFQIRGLLKILISALNLTQKIGNQLELPCPSTWRIVRRATTLHLLFTVGHTSRTVTCPTQAVQQRPLSLSSRVKSGPYFICLFKVAFHTETWSLCNARLAYSGRAPSSQAVYCSVRTFSRSSTATQPMPIFSSGKQRNLQSIVIATNTSSRLTVDQTLYYTHTLSPL